MIFFADVQPVLRLLPFEIKRICGYRILRAAEEEIADFLASSVPSLSNSNRGVDFDEISSW